MRSLSIPTTTHGRVVVEDAAASPVGLLVAFHGYAQSADETLADVRTIPGAERVDDRVRAGPASFL